MPGKLLVHDPIQVDLKVYRLEAVKKCVYRLSGDWQIDISLTDTDKALVRYAPANDQANSADFSYLFRQDLIDQEMRCVVQERTEAIKNLILAQAYAPVSLLGGSENPPPE